jgi:hypothetical protein
VAEIDRWSREDVTLVQKGTVGWPFWARCTPPRHSIASGSAASPVSLGSGGRGTGGGRSKWRQRADVHPQGNGLDGPRGILKRFVRDQTSTIIGAVIAFPAGSNSTAARPISVPGSNTSGSKGTKVTSPSAFVSA